MDADEGVCDQRQLEVRRPRLRLGSEQVGERRGEPRIHLLFVGEQGRAREDHFGDRPQSGRRLLFGEEPVHVQEET
jgi:hypothetical protein